ncbi:carbamoyl phosphate synthase preATP-grasp domain-containing protein [Granulicella paludicola]
MPRGNDAARNLLLGFGSIVIGQSSECDFSGMHMCKAPQSERDEVVGINRTRRRSYRSLAKDRRYIGPLTPERNA